MSRHMQMVGLAVAVLMAAVLTSPARASILFADNLSFG